MEQGAQNGCIIADKKLDIDLALEKIKLFAGIKYLDLDDDVTTKDIYTWIEETWHLAACRWIIDYQIT